MGNWRKSAERSRPSVVEPLESRQLLALTIDLRPAGMDGSKAVQVSSVGQVVPIDVFALISGSGTGTFGLISASGSFLSTDVSGGAARGTLQAIREADFTGSGSSAGTQVDLDSDGDLDVGSNNPASAAGYFSVRATSAPTAVEGREIKIATVNFTVTSLLPGTRTEVNFRVRGNGPTHAVWIENGATRSPDTATFNAGAPIVITRQAGANTPPNATLAASNVTTAGATTHSFNVTYADNSGINVSTVDNADIRVTGPNGYSQLATRVSPQGTNGTPRTFTYSIPAPGGSWDSTDNGTYTVTMLSNAVADDAGAFVPAGNLGTFQASIPVLGRISGIVFNDLNGNGLRDAGEPGLPNVRVFLDKDNDGVLDSNEKSRLTAPSGAYRFGDLPAGTYRVKQILPAGFRQSAPPSGYFRINLAEGQAFSNRNFGNTQRAAIFGRVFNDVNGSRRQEAGEANLANWTVFLDQDSSGAPSIGERSFVTGADGAFAFTDLTPGTWRLRIAPAAGWERTTPKILSTFDIVVAAAQVVDGRLFGMRRI